VIFFYVIIVVALQGGMICCDFIVRLCGTFEGAAVRMREGTVFESFGNETGLLDSSFIQNGIHCTLDNSLSLWISEAERGGTFSSVSP